MDGKNKLKVGLGWWNHAVLLHKRKLKAEVRNKAVTNMCVFGIVYVSGVE